MIISYDEFSANMIADEGKDLLRVTDQLRAKVVSTPLGEEKDWIEVDEIAEEII